MASSHCIRIAIFVFSVMTRDIGVFGRALDKLGFLSQSQKTADESSGPTLRMDSLRRGIAETHLERCAELVAPWQENTQAPEDNATLLQLRVQPFSPRASRHPVFPGKSLFSFVRRVYHCCQEGVNCRSVRGIQGRLRRGTDVEFLLTRDILSLTIMRAELHLQLANPQHLDIYPVLSSMAKRDLPTRYSLWSQSNTVELRVDLLFLFQNLKQATGGAGGAHSLAKMREVAFSSRRYPPGEKPASGALHDTDTDVWGDGVASTLPALELGLVLGCSRAASGVSCGTGGVHLSHTPFMALYYR
ncbi:uncharacterized protein LOC116384568 [Anarrhichthys ocellatus]|uniref:uncharacterized protein LOC116384568 n=1 Tax=Anarrhichthys ocellatus TaxID=433405 RepID=UPI0012ED5D71|nr:uncharacterized protein LOC116384568 [Anarrhichthys ocellatus]